MVDKNDALLREVDEELRREQLEKLWQKYGGYAFIVALLIVVGVGGTKWLEARRQAAAEAAGASYSAAIDALKADKPEDALKTLGGLATQGPVGYAQLAQLQLAGAALKAGKTADALKSLEEIGKNTSADRLLRGFAQLQAASLRLGEADFTEMQNRLNSLTGESSPYKVSARELLGFAAFKAGKLEEARKLLEPLLIDPNATRAIQDRIKVVMAEITAAELAKEPASGAAPQATEPAKPDAAASPASAQTAPADKPETEPAATQTVPPAAAAGEDAGKAGDSKTEADKAGADKTGAGGTEEKAAPATPAQ